MSRSRPTFSGPARAIAVAGGVALAAGSVLPAASADPNNNTSRKLRAAVSAEGMLEHLQALQDIADANGGTRVSGSPGYDASKDYAVEVFENAGYDVTVQPFDFQTFITLSPPVLERVSAPAGPLPTTIFSYSGSGDVTAPVSLTADAASTADQGCQSSDFAGFPAGSIALVSRGGCTFALKATNALLAGATAVVIYNNGPGQINGTLGNDFTADIPVLAVDQQLGQELASQVPGLVLRVSANTFRGQATTYNVLAESRWGDPDNVVMAGAHLDSVNAGAGINDNGSGSAAILEVAEQMAKVKPTNQVRFALWGAEESGLVGATYYVSNLSEEERQDIALYLNFDMIASANYVRFVYDGDDSDGVGNGPGPEGSAQIEDVFTDYFASQGLASKGTDFSGRSDYGPFIAVGIPSGGLFTGAEGIKTAEEAAVYGGVAGAAYDPCYHQFCDSLTYDFASDPARAAVYAALDAQFDMVGNVNLTALEEMGDAVAHSVITYAFDTRSVNGTGKGHPVSPPGQHVDGGADGSGEPGGGGLHDDHDHEQDAA